MYSRSNNFTDRHAVDKVLADKVLGCQRFSSKRENRHFHLSSDENQDQNHIYKNSVNLKSLIRYREISIFVECSVMSLTLMLNGKNSVLALNYFPAIDLSDDNYEFDDF